MAISNDPRLGRQAAPVRAGFPLGVSAIGPLAFLCVIYLAWGFVIGVQRGEWMQAILFVALAAGTVAAVRHKREHGWTILFASTIAASVIRTLMP